MYDHLLISRPADKILQITLNRPKQLNALGRTTIQELQNALLEFEQQSQDLILILTGSGRAFCFGADFQEFEETASLQDLLELFQDLIARLYYCSKITIASLNGFATGAGLDLALACDFRISAEKIKLAEAYISMGLVPDGGGTSLLTRLIGPARALDMLVSGEAISSEDAMALGIVHRIFPSQELQSRCLEFAGKLSEKPQTALRLIKKLVKENSVTDLRTALENESKAQLICFEDPMHRQLVKDFLEKRRKKISPPEH